jgi:hypothetical protein
MFDLFNLIDAHARPGPQHQGPVMTAEPVLTLLITLVARALPPVRVGRLRVGTWSSTNPRQDSAGWLQRDGEVTR